MVISANNKQYSASVESRCPVMPGRLRAQFRLLRETARLEQASLTCQRCLCLCVQQIHRDL